MAADEVTPRGTITSERSIPLEQLEQARDYFREMGIFWPRKEVFFLRGTEEAKTLEERLHLVNQVVACLREYGTASLTSLMDQGVIIANSIIEGHYQHTFDFVYGKILQLGLAYFTQR